MLNSLPALGYLLFCLAAPAYMPGRWKMTPLQFQLLLAPLALASLAGLWLSLRPASRQGRALPWRPAVALAAAALLLAGLPMHAMQAGRYASMGYAPDWAVLGLGSAALGAGFAWMAWRRVEDWRAWALLLAASAAFLLAFSIACYPLDHRRSDMMKMLAHGGLTWARGASLTDAYTGGKGIELTYLPGLWQTYLPATLAGVDLRWASLIALLASLPPLLLASAPSRRPLALFLLAVFLLSPWMVFRHECYVPGLLPFAGLAAWGAAKGRWWALALGAAWMACQSQMAWMALPFLLWHARLRWGWGPAVGMGMAILAALAASLGPYLWADRGDIMANVFTRWDALFYPEGPNASWWLGRFLGLPALRLVQAGALVLLFLALARRLARPAAALAGAALALALFTALNNIVRDYFYFYPAYFLAFSMVLEPGPGDPEPGQNA